MQCLLTRRNFLAAAANAPWLAHRALAQPPVPAKKPPTLDLHIHLFGAGDNGSDCVLSQAVQKGPLFALLSEKLQIKKKGPTIDQGYVAALAEQLKASGLTKGVILAQDAIYDGQGKPDWRKTSFYVPNDYVLKVAAEYPDLMVPCLGINPDRED